MNDIIFYRSLAHTILQKHAASIIHNHETYCSTIIDLFNHHQEDSNIIPKLPNIIFDFEIIRPCVSSTEQN